jgi:hypothetical protein
MENRRVRDGRGQKDTDKGSESIAQEERRMKLVEKEIGFKK